MNSQEANVLSADYIYDSIRLYDFVKAIRLFRDVINDDKLRNGVYTSMINAYSGSSDTNLRSYFSQVVAELSRDENAYKAIISKRFPNEPLTVVNLDDVSTMAFLLNKFNSLSDKTVKTLEKWSSSRELIVLVESAVQEKKSEDRLHELSQMISSLDMRVSSSFFPALERFTRTAEKFLPSKFDKSDYLSTAEREFMNIAGIVNPITPQIRKIAVSIMDRRRYITDPASIAATTHLLNVFKISIAERTKINISTHNPFGIDTMTALLNLIGEDYASRFISTVEETHKVAYTMTQYDKIYNLLRDNLVVAEITYLVLSSTQDGKKKVINAIHTFCGINESDIERTDQGNKEADSKSRDGDVNMEKPDIALSNDLRRKIDSAEVKLALDEERNRSEVKAIINSLREVGAQVNDRSTNLEELRKLAAVHLYKIANISVPESMPQQNSVFRGAQIAMICNVIADFIISGKVPYFESNYNKAMTLLTQEQRTLISSGNRSVEQLYSELMSNNNSPFSNVRQIYLVDMCERLVSMNLIFMVPYLRMFINDYAQKYTNSTLDAKMKKCLDDINVILEDRQKRNAVVTGYTAVLEQLKVNLAQTKSKISESIQNETAALDAKWQDFLNTEANPANMWSRFGTLQLNSSNKLVASAGLTVLAIKLLQDRIKIEGELADSKSKYNSLRGARNLIDRFAPKNVNEYGSDVETTFVITRLVEMAYGRDHSRDKLSAAAHLMQMYGDYVRVGSDFTFMGIADVLYNKLFSSKAYKTLLTRSEQSTRTLETVLDVLLSKYVDEVKTDTSDASVFRQNFKKEAGLYGDTETKINWEQLGSMAYYFSSGYNHVDELRTDLSALVKVHSNKGNSVKELMKLTQTSAYQQILRLVQVGGKQVIESLNTAIAELTPLIDTLQRDGEIEISSDVSQSGEMIRIIIACQSIIPYVRTFMARTRNSYNSGSLKSVEERLNAIGEFIEKFPADYFKTFGGQLANDILNSAKDIEKSLKQLNNIDTGIYPAYLGQSSLGEVLKAIHNWLRLHFGYVSSNANNLIQITKNLVSGSDGSQDPKNISESITRLGSAVSYVDGLKAIKGTIDLIGQQFVQGYTSSLSSDSMKIDGIGKEFKTISDKLSSFETTLDIINNTLKECVPSSEARLLEAKGDTALFRRIDMVKSYSQACAKYVGELQEVMRYAHDIAYTCKWTTNTFDKDKATELKGYLATQFSTFDASVNALRQAFDQNAALDASVLGGKPANDNVQEYLKMSSSVVQRMAAQVKHYNELYNGAIALINAFPLPSKSSPTTQEEKLIDSKYLDHKLASDKGLHLQNIVKEYTEAIGPAMKNCGETFKTQLGDLVKDRNQAGYQGKFIKELLDKIAGLRSSILSQLDEDRIRSIYRIREGANQPELINAVTERSSVLLGAKLGEMSELMKRVLESMDISGDAAQQPDPNATTPNGVDSLFDLVAKSNAFLLEYVNYRKKLDSSVTALNKIHDTMQARLLEINQVMQAAPIPFFADKRLGATVRQSRLRFMYNLLIGYIYSEYPDMTHIENIEKSAYEWKTPADVANSMNSTQQKYKYKDNDFAPSFLWWLVKEIRTEGVNIITSVSKTAAIQAPRIMSADFIDTALTTLVRSTQQVFIDIRNMNDVLIESNRLSQMMCASIATSCDVLYNQFTEGERKNADEVLNIAQQITESRNAIDRMKKEIEKETDFQAQLSARKSALEASKEENKKMNGYLSQLQNGTSAVDINNMMSEGIKVKGDAVNKASVETKIESYIKNNEKKIAVASTVIEALQSKIQQIQQQKERIQQEERKVSVLVEKSKEYDDLLLYIQTTIADVDRKTLSSEFTSQATLTKLGKYLTTQFSQEQTKPIVAAVRSVLTSSSNGATITEFKRLVEAKIGEMASVQSTRLASSLVNSIDRAKELLDDTKNWYALYTKAASELKQNLVNMQNQGYGPMIKYFSEMYANVESKNQVQSDPIVRTALNQNQQQVPSYLEPNDIFKGSAARNTEQWRVYLYNSFSESAKLFKEINLNYARFTQFVKNTGRGLMQLMITRLAAANFKDYAADGSEIEFESMFARNTDDYNQRKNAVKAAAKEYSKAFQEFAKYVNDNGSNTREVKEELALLSKAQRPETTPLIVNRKEFADVVKQWYIDGESVNDSSVLPLNTKQLMDEVEAKYSSQSSELKEKIDKVNDLLATLSIAFNTVISARDSVDKKDEEKFIGLIRSSLKLTKRMDESQISALIQKEVVYKKALDNIKKQLSMHQIHTPVMNLASVLLRELTNTSNMLLRAIGCDPFDLHSFVNSVIAALQAQANGGVQISGGPVSPLVEIEKYQRAVDDVISALQGLGADDVTVDKSINSRYDAITASIQHMEKALNSTSDSLRGLIQRVDGQLFQLRSENQRLASSNEVYRNTATSASELLVFMKNVGLSYMRAMYSSYSNNMLQMLNPSGTSLTSASTISQVTSPPATSVSSVFSSLASSGTSSTSSSSSLSPTSVPTTTTASLTSTSTGVTSSASSSSSSSSSLSSTSTPPTVVASTSLSSSSITSGGDGRYASDYYESLRKRIRSRFFLPSNETDKDTLRLISSQLGQIVRQRKIGRTVSSDGEILDVSRLPYELLDDAQIRLAKGIIDLTLRFSGVDTEDSAERDDDKSSVVIHSEVSRMQTKYVEAVFGIVRQMNDDLVGQRVVTKSVAALLDPYNGFAKAMTDLISTVVDSHLASREVAMLSITTSVVEKHDAALKTIETVAERIAPSIKEFMSNETAKVIMNIVRTAKERVITNDGKLNQLLLEKKDEDWKAIAKALDSYKGDKRPILDAIQKFYTQYVFDPESKLLKSIDEAERTGTSRSLTSFLTPNVSEFVAQTRQDLSRIDSAIAANREEQRLEKLRKDAATAVEASEQKDIRISNVVLPKEANKHLDKLIMPILRMLTQSMHWVPSIESIWSPSIRSSRLAESTAVSTMDPVTSLRGLANRTNRATNETNIDPLSLIRSAFNTLNSEVDKVGGDYTSVPNNAILDTIGSMIQDQYMRYLRGSYGMITSVYQKAVGYQDVPNIYVVTRIDKLFTMFNSAVVVLYNSTNFDRATAASAMRTSALLQKGMYDYFSSRDGSYAAELAAIKGASNKKKTAKNTTSTEKAGPQGPPS